MDTVKTKTMGEADAVSREHLEGFVERLDLYNKLAAGMRDVREGRVAPASESISRVRSRIRA